MRRLIVTGYRDHRVPYRVEVSVDDDASDDALTDERVGTAEVINEQIESVEEVA
jgi:hypothetical protein